MRAAHDLAANTAADSANARAADKERAAEAAVAAAAALRAASRPHLLWRDADARLILPLARPDSDEAELHQVLSMHMYTCIQLFRPSTTERCKHTGCCEALGKSGRCDQTPKVRRLRGLCCKFEGQRHHQHADWRRGRDAPRGGSARHKQWRCTGRAGKSGRRVRRPFFACIHHRLEWIDSVLPSCDCNVGAGYWCPSQGNRM